MWHAYYCGMDGQFRERASFDKKFLLNVGSSYFCLHFFAVPTFLENLLDTLLKSKGSKNVFFYFLLDIRVCIFINAMIFVLFNQCYHSFMVYGEVRNKATERLGYLRLFVSIPCITM